jgi:hypothetical protein
MPHWFSVTAPHCWGAMQFPHSTALPQLSTAVPQDRPAQALPEGTHEGSPPQTFRAPPPPQVAGAAQSPQYSWRPQPSSMPPQVALTSLQLLQMRTLPASAFALPASRNPPQPTPLMLALAKNSQVAVATTRISKKQEFAELMPGRCPAGIKVASRNCSTLNSLGLLSQKSSENFGTQRRCTALL